MGKVLGFLVVEVGIVCVSLWVILSELIEVINVNIEDISFCSARLTYFCLDLGSCVSDVYSLNTLSFLSCLYFILVI